MRIYEFYCEKCKSTYERMCEYENIKIQRCVNCGELLKRKYSVGHLKNSTFSWNVGNDTAIAKPRTPEQKRKYKEYMEHSIPISSSIT